MKSACEYIYGIKINGAVRPNDSSPIHSTIACLLYFNEKPGGVSGTQVYDKDRKTVLFSVPNLRNSFFFLEQHPDSWHGFPSVPEGSERRIVSLSYSQEKRPITLHDSLFYRLISFLRARGMIQQR